MEIPIVQVATTSLGWPHYSSCILIAMLDVLLGEP